MLSIGWRNMKRDRLRMAVAVCGVVFAVVLVTMEVGMLLGLVESSSLLIDGSHADLWVSTVDVKTFDFASPFEERKKYLLQSVPGVEKVEEFNVSYSVWKLSTGGNSNCQVVGFDTRGSLAPRLPLVAGRLEDLRNQDAVIIDEGERAKLGNPKIGDCVEIINQKARVVGFTRGMHSFTTTPYVFAELKRAEKYGWVTMQAKPQGARLSIYFLVKVAPGFDREKVRHAIEAAVPDVEAHTRESFSWRTRKYWLLETGVGLGFLAAAMLGMIVGGVIVSQTLYAMTVEKLPEFGVLKAMGASMGELARVVLEQGLACGAIGWIVGLAISVALGAAADTFGTAVLIPWALVVGVGVLTAILCTGASMVSIVRLRRLEPAAVFRT